MTLDPARILEVLAKHEVAHVVVGGIGAVLHGSPMSTDDVDIVPALRKSNLEALAAALNEMKARLMSNESSEGIEMTFTAKNLQKWIVEFRFLNLLTDYGRLDIIHRPEGTTGYGELASSAETLEIGDVEVTVAALEDIIRSKQAAGRDRDLAQLPTLRSLLQERQASLKVGDAVLVPRNVEEVRGTLLEVRGSGPRAQSTVRVELPDGTLEDLTLPLSILRQEDT